MSLKETLKGIVENVDGALAAIIMAGDGIPVEQYLRESGFELQTLAIEYTAAIREIRRTVEILKVGELEEVGISTGELSVIIRTAGDDLFVVLILAKNGNSGMGRYQLRLKSADLTRELA